MSELRIYLLGRVLFVGCVRDISVQKAKVQSSKCVGDINTDEESKETPAQ
jgi:hypothetical protein